MCVFVAIFIKVVNNIGKVLCLLLLPVLICVMVPFSSTVLEPNQPPRVFVYTRWSLAAAV